MKKLLSVAGAALLTALAAVFALGQPAQAATGFSVSNGRLYDANGVEFVMRGVNHAHTWYPQQTSSFANIKALGANTVLLQTALDEAAGRIVVVAAVDNLAKGTAGGAVQSANIALGLPEELGLTTIGVSP